MTDQPSNPAPVTEADLIGWVEGTLPAARDRLLRAELTRNPTLALRLQAMTRDRAILSSIPDEQAPAALMDAVQEALERQTLFADAPAFQLPRRRTGFAGLSRWASKPNLAMAAGIALVVTGGVYWTLVLSSANPIIRNMPADDGSPLASGGSSSTGSMPLPQSPAGPASHSTSAPSDVMFASMVEPGGAALNAGSELAYSNSDMETLALAEAVMRAENGPARRPLDAKSIEIKRALELAAQGRLVIRVRTSSESRVAAKMDALAASASRRDPVRAWRVEGDIPPTLMASIVESGPMLDVSERQVAPMPAIAGSEPSELGRQMGVTVPPRFVRDPLPALKSPLAACMAEFRPNAITLQALVAALSQKLGGEVTLSEASTSYTPSPDPADASSVLWWTQPTSNWGNWISVPVVVENAR